MTFAHAIRTCFQRYVTFSGRASRSEFWYIAPLFLGFAGLAVTLTADFHPILLPIPEISSVIGLFVLLSWPVWPAAARRLRDAGYSAAPVWWMLGLTIGGLVFFLVGSACASAPACTGGGLGKSFGVLLVFGPAFIAFILGPLICAAMILTLSLAPSNTGANRYDPENGARSP